MVAVAAVILAVLALRRCPVLAAFLAGFAMLWSDASRQLGDRLETGLEGRDVNGIFRVADFPVAEGPVLRFDVQPLGASGLPARLRLSVYDAEWRPRLGDCLDLTVRLRRPRGFANPGRFDYEAWLFTRRYGATGYVRSVNPMPGCPESRLVGRVRATIAERLLQTLPADPAAGVLLAVTIGARQWLPDTQWRNFAATGTSHLMAISGMHVALASGAVLLLLRGALALGGFSGNQQRLAALLALAFALGYVALSGFAVPARRAFIMLALAVIAWRARRRVDAWQVLGVAAVAVLLLAPLDVLSSGFRLSFGAVAALVWIGRSAQRSQQARAGPSGLPRVQLALFFALTPVVATLFGRVSWVAPAVNLCVVPVFGLFVLPAALLGAVLPGPPGDWLLYAAWYAVRSLLAVVATAAALPFADRVLPAPGTLLVLASIAVTLYLCLPAGWPGRGAALLALLPFAYPPRPETPTGCADIDVLDVGQGLAVVLRTRERALLFDAGPSFRSGSDTGRLVVRPVLEHAGVDRLDVFIVSHGDNDHAGGFRSVARHIDVGVVLSGEPIAAEVNLPVTEQGCRAGTVWEWDGVVFTILHPNASSLRRGNDASCVLEVNAGGYRALLTGDIEAATERRLAGSESIGAVDVVVVPHHGSKTSSSQVFVDRSGPRFAVVSAGYRNRWGMPHADVVARWEASGAVVRTTATSGAIGYRLCATSGVSERYRHRVDARRPWTER